MLLEGKPVAEKIKNEILEAVSHCKSNGSGQPKLAILRVGERPDDISYEEKVIKNCEAVGILVETINVDNNIDMVNLTKTLNHLNNDSKIHGILIFKPLPEQLNITKNNKEVIQEKVKD